MNEKRRWSAPILEFLLLKEKHSTRRMDDIQFAFSTMAVRSLYTVVTFK